MRKTYREDRLVILGCLVIIVAILAVAHFHHSKEIDLSYTPGTPHSKQTIVPSVYPSPNKIARDINTTYQLGTVTYEIMVGDSTVGDRNTQNYYIQYTNTSASPVTVPSSLNIGCVAADNQSYHQVPNIFTSGALASLSNTYAQSSLAALSRQASLTLPVWDNPVTVSIEVSSNCQYLGTLDGVYGWQLF